MFKVVAALVSKSSAQLLESSSRLTNVRYSQYSPNFIDPLYKKELQKAVEEAGEIDNYLYRPVKAARNNETCSIFHDPLVAKFTNHVMEDGRKQLARSLVEKTFEQVKRNQIQLYNQATTDAEKDALILDPLIIFKMAIKNVTPILKLTKIKKGGNTYQVPYPITDHEALFRAMKWLIDAGNEKRNPIHFPQKMAWELVDASNNKGVAVKRKLELHRQCEANRAYAHYRWS